MLHDFFAKDFDQYFQRVGSGSPLWMFVHVPKTAGSSLTVEAEALLQPSFNIDIDHTDTSTSYAARFDASVQRFIASQAERQYRFCTGHINARHVEMIKQGVPELRCFSILRNPLARLVSDYRYQRSAMNTAREAFIANTPSFETYVARRHVHNKITMNLTPRSLVEAGDAAACVKYIMDHYDFIGLQEMFTLSMRTLTTLMGETRAPQAQMRVNSGDQDRVDLTPDMESFLRELNAVDIAVYQAFVVKFRAIREDLIMYLRRNSKVRADAV